jgi:hypothetical protein
MGLRFYIDADLLGVAKVLATVRSDVTFPGDPGGLGADGLNRPACTVKPSDKDVDWLGVVTGQGLTVITRDRHIRSRPAEKQAIVEHSARVITLDGRRGLRKWDQLEIIVTQWRKFEELSELPGPWVYTASRTGCRRFDLS